MVKNTLDTQVFTTLLSITLIHIEFNLSAWTYLHAPAILLCPPMPHGGMKFHPHHHKTAVKGDFSTEYFHI